MNRFNAPPGWPPPPDPDWRPPPGWQPEPGWPPAPGGWKFWVNERGGRSIGPQGAYGSIGRGRLAVAGGTAAGLLLFGLGALVGDPAPAGGADTPAAAPTVTATATVTTTVAAKAPPPRPATTVTVRPKPLPRATVTVTARPTATRAPDPEPQREPTTAPTTAPTRIAPVLPRVTYYKNCDAARAAGVAPLRRGDPGYAGHLDRDNDGIACE